MLERRRSEEAKSGEPGIEYLNCYDIYCIIMCQLPMQSKVNVLRVLRISVCLEHERLDRA